MRWQGGRRSSNIEDRRGRPARRGGGGAGMRVGGAGGAIVLIVAVVMVAMGKDPSALLDAAAAGGVGGGPSASANGGAVAPRPGEDAQADFVSVILADTEDVWTQIFAQRGQRYPAPRLVLFREGVRSACGFTSSAVGPFYCPGDNQVYIDLQFFDQLDRQFGAPGDFAQAYVIAHEVGHHLQSVLGISDRVRAHRRRVSEAEANGLSVRQELQADCFAGVWAHHAHRQRQLLEAGDIEEGLRAAAAIGDDTLQRRSGGRIAPESWTHGSSDQRVRWFRIGLDGGDMNRCDTFSVSRL